MATLVFSQQCKFCIDVLTMVQENPEIRKQMHVHDIADGVPAGVTRVPAIMNGSDIIVGGDAKNFILNLLDKDQEPGIGTGVHYVSIDGSDDVSNKQYCDLMDMNVPKSAPMTREFQERMNKKVE